MKETTTKAPSALFTCTCGAVPYDAEKRPKGKVAVARWRRNQGWVVVCTRCGRVREPGDCPADACARWEGRRYRHEP